VDFRGFYQNTIGGNGKNCVFDSTFELESNSEDIMGDLGHCRSKPHPSIQSSSSIK